MAAAPDVLGFDRLWLAILLHRVEVDPLAFIQLCEQGCDLAVWVQDHELHQLDEQVGGHEESDILLHFRGLWGIILIVHMSTLSDGSDGAFREGEKMTTKEVSQMTNP
jgi:hypothetical protein